MKAGKIEKEDLEKVLKTMEQYNREDGYIAAIEQAQTECDEAHAKATLTFFDAPPSNGGAFITKRDIENHLKNWPR